jgi:hypothetical protein
MGSDEIAKLKAELHSLNCHIQAERNDEVRHGLQRIRLENERAALLVKLIDAQIASVTVPPPAHSEPQLVVPLPPLPEVPLRRRVKPEGLPSMSTMIVTALQASGRAQRPVDIANYVRQRWWPTLATPAVNSQVWHMAKNGKLTCRDGLYGLNGIGH